MLVWIINRASGQLIAEARQLPLLRYSLIALYVGIAVDAVAALLGHLLVSDEELARSITIVLSCLGVACLIIAVVCLIIDTSHSELRQIERSAEFD